MHLFAIFWANFQNLVYCIHTFLSERLMFFSKTSRGLKRKMHSLLETRTLPRAWGFAEGQISGTRQRDSLSRARHRSPRQRTALGKDRPTANQIFSRASALGKDALGKVGPLGHGGHFPSNFAEGHPLGPRQRFGKFFLSLCRGPQTRPSAKIFLKPVFGQIFFL